MNGRRRRGLVGLALAICALVVPAVPARAQTIGSVLRPTGSQQTSVAVVLTDANGFDFQANVDVDTGAHVLVTTTSAMAIGAVTVTLQVGEAALIFVGDQLVDADDITSTEVLTVSGVNLGTDTLTFPAPGATEAHALGTRFSVPVTGRALVSTGLFLAGNTLPIIATSQTGLTAGASTTLDLSADEAVAFSVGDQIVDVTNGAANELLTVAAVDMGLDRLTFTAAATETHALGNQYMVVASGREPCDLAVEFVNFRKFSSGSPFTLPILGRDLVRIDVTVDLPGGAANIGDIAAAVPACHADEFDGNATNEAPDLFEEWVAEILFDTNGDGVFDVRDTDQCDLFAGNIGSSSCGIVEVPPTAAFGEPSAVGVLPFTFSKQLEATLSGLPDAAASAASDPAPANTGDGTLGSITVNNRTTKADTWTVVCIDTSGGVGSETWSVTGSVAGLQIGQATTGLTFTADNSEMTFLISAGATAFVVADDFEFDTTKAFDVNTDLWVRVRNQVATVNTSGLDVIDVSLTILFDTGGGGGFNIVDTTIPVAYKGDATTPAKTFDATGGVVPYTWVKTAGNFPPGISGATTGVDPDYQLTGTPTEAGEFQFTMQVTDSTGTPQVIEYNIVYFVDGLEIQVDGKTVDGISTPEPNVAYSETYIPATFDADGNDFPAGTADWSLPLGAEPVGLTFTPALPSFVQSQETLAGTPTGTTYSFTLQAVDTAFGVNPQLTAFTDNLVATGTGIDDIRIIGTPIPDVVQGMRYTSTDATLPPVVVLQAANASGIPPAAQWSIVPEEQNRIPPNDALQLRPTAGSLLQAYVVGADVQENDEQGVVPVDAAGATGAGSVAGNYGFKVKAVDAADDTKSQTKVFSFRILPRQTRILAGPGTVSEDTVLTFTVFAEGGVPTAGTSFGPAPACDEVRNGQSGIPHYQLQYRVDPEILPGDDPNDDDDAGRYMGDSANTDADYKIVWLDWTEFPDNTPWPAHTSPVTINIDLNNDPATAIAETALSGAIPKKASMKPSASTGRRYRVRFRAKDGIARGLCGTFGDASDLTEASTVVQVVAPGGQDTNPDPTRPTRLRQERFN